MLKEHNRILIYIILILSIAALILEHGFYSSPKIILYTNILDYAVLFLFLIDITFNFLKYGSKIYYIKKNYLYILLLAGLTAFIIYNSFKQIIPFNRIRTISIEIILIRNFIIIIQILRHIRRLNNYLKEIIRKPAQTFILSFLFVILCGAIFLMMPFSTADNSRIGFINALFTSTSAVCVTGLTVLNTATKFSLFGKIIIMILIQIGGLGIMILSYFSGFILGRKLSLEDKMFISYILDQQDMKKISHSIAYIIIATFIIELTGALLLYFRFSIDFGFSSKTVLFSVFHAISAFCNAGFSLFSNNFESYKSDVMINLTICFLIILGGLSFSVINNLFSWIINSIKRKILQIKTGIIKLSLNSTVVLILTTTLIISGMLVIYIFEHKNNLVQFDLKTGYLTAFFQSVTCRTAGFNTINISNLKPYTHLIMILLMIIGAASGSTGGGVKVNTVAIIFAYMRSLTKGFRKTILLKQYISQDLINKAFLIVTLFLVSIFTGTVLISMTDHFSLNQILFECTSAIGTVGLSTGITEKLSDLGKMMITLLMFMGRVGPLTIVTAISQKLKRYEVKYPDGNITIG